MTATSLQSLPPGELEAAMLALPAWTLDAERGGVLREFVFQDFVQAFGFMTQIALHAEKCDHHPEWSNVYHRVSVLLTTHDANGVTTKDIDMARLMERVAASVLTKGDADREPS